LALRLISLVRLIGLDLGRVGPKIYKLGDQLTGS
jgi:hypothetical protein